MAIGLFPGRQFHGYQQPDESLWAERVALRLDFDATGIGATHGRSGRPYLRSPGSFRRAPQRHRARSSGANRSTLTRFARKKSDNAQFLSRLPNKVFGMRA